MSAPCNVADKSVDERLDKVDQAFATIRESFQKLQLPRTLNDAVYADYGDAIRLLHENVDTVATFTRASLTSSEIPRHGDLLVGFIATQDTDFTVSVGGTKVCSTRLAKGQFAFAVEDAFVLPLLCLAFQLIKVSQHDGLDVVYGHLQCDDRKVIARNAWYSHPVAGGKYMVFRNGGMSLESDRPEDAMELPEVARVADVYSCGKVEH